MTTTTATKIDRHLATAIRATLRTSRAAHRHLVEAVEAGAATVEAAAEFLLGGEEWLGAVLHRDGLAEAADAAIARHPDAVSDAESRYAREIAPALVALAEAE